MCRRAAAGYGGNDRGKVFGYLKKLLDEEPDNPTLRFQYARLLDEYGGTILIVSHDRDFLDRVVSSIIYMKGHYYHCRKGVMIWMKETS